MDNMQEQMNSILNNPEMMQQIMSMAQALNQSQPSPQDNVPPQNNSVQETSFPEFDLSMIQKLSGLAGQTNIDKNQKSLLTALTPYLSKDRIYRLEKAMRAAKMANLASSFLGNSGLLSNMSR